MREKAELARQPAVQQPPVPPDAGWISAGHVTQYSGPLPSPRMLVEYNQAHPGLADRIIKMAEDEAAARRKMEADVLAAQAEDLIDKRRIIKRGQLFAIVFAVAGLAVAGWVTVYNHPNVGVTIAGTTIISVVGAFLYTNTKRPEVPKPVVAPPTTDLTEPSPPTLGGMSRPAGDDAGQ